MAPLPQVHLDKYFLYLFFKLNRRNLVGMGNGSVFTNLKTQILKDYPIALPPIEKRERFRLLLNPLFQKILKNQETILTTSKQKETLLPKLMSGEVRVQMD